MAFRCMILASAALNTVHGSTVHYVIPGRGRMGVRQNKEAISMWHDCAAWVGSKLVLGSSAGAILLQGALLPSTLVLD